MKSTILAIIYFMALVVTGLLLTAALPTNPTGPGTPADSTVSQLTAATTASGTDVYYIVSGGSSKKITHATLMSIIRDSIKARSYATAGDWSFDGATFDNNSAGKVTFNDSVVFAAGWYATSTGKTYSMIPSTTNSYYIGNGTYRYGYGYYGSLYANQFIVTNPSSPSLDTLLAISYDGTDLVFGPLSYDVGNDIITLGADSSVLQNLCLSEANYNFSLATDSVITLANIESGVIISKSLGVAVTGLETINMTNAGDGQVLVITSRAGYTVTFEDEATTGGNLKLAGNFAMAEDDVLTLKYKSSNNKWIEVSRSNN